MIPRKYFVVPNLCKGCAICISVCPRDAIVSSSERNDYGDPTVRIQDELCTGCGACALLCPDGAIRETEGG